MVIVSGLRGRLLAVSAVVALVAGTFGVGTAQTAASSPAPRQTVSEKIAASKDLLDINAATPAQLKALPGMGDAYVQRIIAGRPYTAKNQLTTRGILPAAAYEEIKPLIIAHRAKPAK